MKGQGCRSIWIFGPPGQRVRSREAPQMVRRIGPRRASPNVWTTCPASVDVSSETGVSLCLDIRTAWTTCPASVDAPPRGDDLLEVVVRLLGQRQELVQGFRQQEDVADEHRGRQAGQPRGA